MKTTFENASTAALFAMVLILGALVGSAIQGGMTTASVAQTTATAWAGN